MFKYLLNSFVQVFNLYIYSTYTCPIYSYIDYVLFNERIHAFSYLKINLLL